MDPIWERQAGEIDDAWKAFVIYRDLGYGRASLCGIGVSTAQAYRWYNEYNWRERVNAYDAWLDHERLNARKDAACRAEAAYGDTIKAQLATMSDIFQAELSAWHQKTNTTGGIMSMAPRELIQLGEFLIKYQRLVNGETTENTGASYDFSDTSLADLRKLMKKAKKK